MSPREDKLPKGLGTYCNNNDIVADCSDNDEVLGHKQHYSMFLPMNLGSTSSMIIDPSSLPEGSDDQGSGKIAEGKQKDDKEVSKKGEKGKEKEKRDSREIDIERKEKENEKGKEKQKQKQKERMERGSEMTDTGKSISQSLHPEMDICIFYDSLLSY